VRQPFNVNSVAQAAALAPHLGALTLVTDAGSTKKDVIAAAQAELGAALPRFVPAHPIAGTEHSGAAAAFPTLFQDRNVILTPTAATAGDALMRIDALWALCGARVTCLDASRHDALFAAVSHLPHALAFALVNALAARPDGDDYFRQAASGFRDFTRLASSDAVMWRDICIANRAALRAELAAYRDELARFDDMLANGDADALTTYFRSARERRNAWLARQGTQGDEA
jgi:prephenate dehydrogenase